MDATGCPSTTTSSALQPVDAKRSSKQSFLMDFERALNQLTNFTFGHNVVNGYFQHVSNLCAFGIHQLKANVLVLIPLRVGNQHVNDFIESWIFHSFFFACLL